MTHQKLFYLCGALKNQLQFIQMSKDMQEPLFETLDKRFENEQTLV